MQSFNVSVDLSGLMAAQAAIRDQLFVNLSAAVERMAMAGAERWRAAVLRAPLWDGERKAYADTIRVEHTGPYSAQIVSDYRYVEDIETGRPPYDMKRMLDTSMKVRVSKKGRRYLIIPMRHNTPGNTALARAMPADVYAQAKTLAPSKIISQGMRQSGTGAYGIQKAGKFRSPFLVRNNNYQWGGKLPDGLAPKMRTEHKTDPYASMYRFQAKTPGGKNYSTYMTFRVMAEGQSGWIIPAKPGLYIAKEISDGLMADAPAIFGRALQTDLSALSAE
ncbi:MAG TPA: hypothetical protein DEQ40_08115 [Oxalobacteraceae bacterium]|nr:hypothetical protein [Oxalobacteraceae bacterium]